MTEDIQSLADQDIAYLLEHAHKHGIEITDQDEEIYLELVGKQVSDGHDDYQARKLAFGCFVSMRR